MEKYRAFSVLGILYQNKINLSSIINENKLGLKIPLKSGIFVCFLRESLFRQGGKISICPAYLFFGYPLGINSCLVMGGKTHINPVVLVPPEGIGPPSRH